MTNKNFRKYEIFYVLINRCAKNCKKYMLVIIDHSRSLIT